MIVQKSNSTSGRLRQTGDPLDYETRTHHSNFDDYDHLVPRDLKQAATIIAAFVYNTAMRKEMMPRKAPAKPEKFIFDDIFSQ